MTEQDKQFDEAAASRREVLKKLGPAAYVAPGLLLLSMPLKADSPAAPPGDGGFGLRRQRSKR
jgi:hypothetical protein